MEDAESRRVSNENGEYWVSPYITSQFHSSIDHQASPGEE